MKRYQWIIQLRNGDYKMTKGKYTQEEVDARGFFAAKAIEPYIPQEGRKCK